MQLAREALVSQATNSEPKQIRVHVLQCFRTSIKQQTGLQGFGGLGAFSNSPHALRASAVTPSIEQEQETL